MIGYGLKIKEIKMMGLMQGRLTLAKSAVICETSGDQYIGGAGLRKGGGDRWVSKVAGGQSGDRWISRCLSDDPAYAGWSRKVLMPGASITNLLAEGVPMINGLQRFKTWALSNHI